jgi:hypothetical protein
MRAALIGAFSLLALTGCAVNGFEKYYVPQPGMEAAPKNPLFEHAAGEEPMIYTYSDDPKSDNLHAQEEGYVFIGQSSFYGPFATMTRAELVAQAKRVGASLVLAHSQYKDTISGVMPWTVPNPPQVSTANSSGTASSYGPGGYATGTYEGQSTITSPGGTTTYNIPYSVSRNDMVATFWARLDRSKIRLGVVTASLPDAFRKVLERNTGVIVNAVIRETPAFNANILRDDVIVRIGGEDVIDPKGFTDQLAKFAGQRVDIELLRGGATKTIPVTLGTRPQH